MGGGNTKFKPPAFPQLNHGAEQISRNHAFVKAFEGHKESISCIKCIDRVIFSTSRDGNMKAWSIKVCQQQSIKN
jgi:hypothetical protein